jgi:hypothetical protein
LITVISLIRFFDLDRLNEYIQPSGRMQFVLGRTAGYCPKSVLPVAISSLRIALLLPIFALMGVFCIEKPVRFELKPVRFGILEKLSR